MVYVVSFKSNSEEMGRIINGVYGVFSAMEKAEDCITQYMTHYNETLFSAVKQSNELFVWITNLGAYTIEPMEIDTYF